MEEKNKKKPERTVIEPPTSSVLLGPREGFNERIQTNLALIKNRLRTNALKIKKLTIGKYTKTKVALLYLEEVANLSLVNNIYEKLSQINIDAIIDSYYLVGFLEEHPNSIFKQVGQTEKPDVLVAKLLEGRVAILCEGSPVALSLPFLLIEDLQSPDDYYQKEVRVSFIRIIRSIGVLISILLPGLYLAVTMYHYKIIPLNLLVTLLNSTANLPFGALVEMLVVILLFEVLYEANLRMPKYLGLAIGIVGALILGDTAVKAGFISPPAVLVVAISNITIYTTPNQAGQLSLLRVLFTLTGAIFSLYGMVIMGLFLILYLTNFESYGTPYLAPFAPKIKSDLKDGVLKENIIYFKNRPKSIATKNTKRLG